MVRNKRTLGDLILRGALYHDRPGGKVSETNPTQPQGQAEGGTWQGPQLRFWFHHRDALHDCS